MKRAVQLGRLPFPQLMERLIRDGNVLEELGRELGLTATDDASLGDRLTRDVHRRHIVP